MTTSATGPRRQLGLWDAISIIVGIVIGAGIYETTPAIAQNTGDPGLFLAVWLVGGVASMVGALCYAELTSRDPRDGGDYLYITEAFGRRSGFLFTWMMFWVVRPANIGAMAFIFARYALQFMPSLAAGLGLALYALAAVVVLSLINILGVRQGATTQNLLTVIKVGGLLLLCLVGFSSGRGDATVPAPIAGEPSFALAMILVLYTFGGWRNIAFVAAEVRQPQRNLLRALVCSTVAVTLMYLLANAAFLHALGFAGVARSGAVATDTMRLLFGAGGATVISVLVCVTCLGNINGMLLTNSRIYYAMGREHAGYRWLGQWHRRFDTPLRALVLQALMTLLLILLFGHQQDAFQRLVVFSAPVHWFFSLLVALSLFRLRRRTVTSRQGFRTPFYPLLPVIFSLTTLFMLYASISYSLTQRQLEGWWVLIILIAGMLAAVRTGNGAGSRGHSGD